MWTGSYKNTICQWGIGHGGFFTQRVEFESYDRPLTGPKARAGVLNMIYDCGASRSATPTKVLKASIDEYVNSLDNGERIDLLVISHFDSDHVNGLDYLSSKLNSGHHPVDRVWAPILSPFERLMVSVAFRAGGAVGGTYDRMLLDPAGYLGDLFPNAEIDFLESSTDPIALSRQTIDEEPAVDGRSVFTFSQGNPSPALIVKTNRKTIGSELWEVRPYVLKSTTVAAASVRMRTERLIGKALDKATPSDLARILADTTLVQDFHDALWGHHTTFYKRGFKPSGSRTPPNLSSICIYSGPVNPYDWCRHRAGWGSGVHGWLSALPVAPSWLGTGDAGFRRPVHIKSMVDVLSVNRMDRIGIASAPHHGSSHDSGPDFWNALPNARVVTTESKYRIGGTGQHHPHSLVVDELKVRQLHHHAAQEGVPFRWVDKRIR